MVTIYALVFDDVRVLSAAKTSDPGLGYFTAFICCIFTFEILANFVAKRDYGAYPDCGDRFTVFFWVDLLGTVSLLPDIVVLIDPNTALTLGALHLARAGRAARLGGRVALLVRALRTPSTGEVEVSVTSQLVTELMAKRVVVLVLALVIIVPAMTYFPKDLRHTTALEYLESEKVWEALDTNNPELWTEDLIKIEVIKEWESGGCSDWELENCDGFFMPAECGGACPKSDVVQIMFLQIGNWTIIPEKTEEMALLRNIPGMPEKSELIEFISDSEMSRVVVSTRLGAEKNAWKNLQTTVVVLLFFMFGSVVFKMVIDLHVTEPIEGITALLNRLSTTLTCLAGEETAAAGVVEMDYVTTAFRKMGDLLIKVYGEAGAETIRNNIAGDSNAKGIDALVPGNKSDFIFGFCDIRDFTAATECLEEDVMIFVNGVGQIVHDIVVRNGGFPNKNVGDAFLVVWRPPEGGLAAIADQGAEVNIADKALTAIVTSAEYVNYDSKLKALLDGNEKLQARMPGFRVKIGFGLHAGWALEGPIGSSIKVDCSYLGPHQDMAERLETATKIYGVGLLVTDTFYDLLSPERKRTMRTCDRVLCDKLGANGNSIPVRLYAVAPGGDEGNMDLTKINQYTSDSEAGMEDYINGDWSSAVKKLQAVADLNPNDEPVRLVIKYMSLMGNKAPGNVLRLATRATMCCLLRDACCVLFAALQGST